MREPLLSAVAAVATGIAASRWTVFSWTELAPGLAALVLLAAVAFWRNERRAGWIGVFFAFVLLGALSASWRRAGPPPVIDATPHETVIVEGCVVQPAVFHNGRQTFVAELAPAARASVRVYYDEGEQPLDLRYGQRADMIGKIRRPRNFQNPGAFDYEGYLARQDIYWTISVKGRDGIALLPGGCGSRFWTAIHAVRRSALTRLDILFPGNRQAAALLRAVLLGESSQLEEVWKEAFRQTGTYHTLVISGLHLTVLAGLVHAVLRVFSLRLGFRIALTIVLAWLYACLTGCTTPVMRAAGGLSLFLIAGWLYRRRRLLNILAAVALIFLLLDPDQLFEASFQLSFLAVALIGALAIPWIENSTGVYSRALRGLDDPERDLHLSPAGAQFRVELRLLAETASLWTGLRQRWLLVICGPILRLAFRAWELFLVSAMIQIGLALPMAVYFQRVSWTGLLANPPVVTLMSFAVQAGSLALLTGSNWIAQIAAALASGALDAAQWFARWEVSWRTPPPPDWLAGFFLASLALAGAAVRHRFRWRYLGSAPLLTALSLMLLHPFPPKVQRGELELTAIDVGQAESLLVAFPDGKLMLVDGGGLPYRNGRKPALDIGEDVVSPYLWNRSIRKLDVLVASHGHVDHIGGLPSILRNFRPKSLWMSAAAADPASLALERLARSEGVQVVRLTAGRRLEFGGAGVEALGPRADTPSTIAANNDSLVIRISFGRRSYLLTGDAEAAEEFQFSQHLDPTDVLKAGHHGSRTSTTPVLLNAARPSFAVISAGFENAYRFPDPAVIDRLARRHAMVLRTDIDGQITFRTNGERIRVDTFRESDRSFKTADLRGAVTAQ